MSFVELRYMASRKWMESEILSGRLVQRRDQCMVVNLEEVDPHLRARIDAIADAVVPLQVRKSRRMCVLDSGIDPELGFGPAKNELVPLDTPIVEAVGALPELPEPSEDVHAVVDAWEGWLKKYKEEALDLFKQLSSDPPKVLRGLNPSFDEDWEPVEISLGEGLDAQISKADGPIALQAARAGHLWAWAASKKFSSESYEAADEATTPAPAQGKEWLRSLEAEALAQLFFEQQKKLFQAAKAHNRARRAQIPDFEDEMKRWADEQGSDRLRLGIADGYRMHSRYLTERLAAEAPGMFAMPANTAQEDWAHKAGSPSEAALRLRRRVDAAMTLNAPPNLDGTPRAEIVIVKKPPHGMFLADPGIETPQGNVGSGLPSREGWTWHLASGQPIDSGVKPFEAVVVKHWLGRYHLIGAVTDGYGGPGGIWAVPDLDLYEENGTVHSQDPDAPPPNAAKRKPPELAKEDDIPF
jgi:hypothetical protein